MEEKLSDYALIGNCRASALVSCTGSVDWCCLPEFDSPAIFAAILDCGQGGYFAIKPDEPFRASQRYLSDTNVVETVFETQPGKARLLDAFTALDEEYKRQSLFPDHELLRVVEGLSGTGYMKMEFVPRLYYGKTAARLENHSFPGLKCCGQENTWILLSSLPPAQVQVSPDQASATAGFRVSAAEKRFFSFSYSGQSPAVLPELQISGWQRMHQTIQYWRKWIGRCRYDGLYPQEVKRSALVLKLLAHAPSGAIIAAPTTSLPEEPGGLRNWDYRYCWLRDASFTVRALIKLGFEQEAHAYMNWILHATQLTRSRLQVVYSVFGHAGLKEKELGWLAGYRGSRPVRIGNNADGQFQLDVYGEVLDAVYAYSDLVEAFDRDTRQFILGLGKIICQCWQEPDQGIWEIRAAPRQHTHSKVMCWVGLHRIQQLSHKYGWKNVPLQKFASAATSIRKQIERHGYNQQVNAYTGQLKGSTLDASLLTMPLVGYCDPMADRMVSTTRLIRERLCCNQLVYRYQNPQDGLQGTEASFGICTCWLVENLAKTGQQASARRVFENMLAHAGPAGLLSEEIDPRTHTLLGNYPQGFTHVGLIHAALAIDEAANPNPAAGAAGLLWPALWQRNPAGDLTGPPAVRQRAGFLLFVESKPRGRQMKPFGRFCLKTAEKGFLPLIKLQAGLYAPNTCLSG